MSGLLLKDSPPEELANAIRAIAGGRRMIDPELALSAWDRRQNPLSTPQSRRCGQDGVRLGLATLTAARQKHRILCR
ncbi:DNA-binding NarL/FixJ family response regulator [Micromonospora profundi]|uniref:response regulator transcription factor n=1 Tax=Micromonospora profundi TaxID=1420889 RepID=UPI00143A2573|nr:response regulator transcription factor [Micromonospora profundi]NJC11462.1 DNA-binding NarL/FixJ family response regulator [Micromonospora profundi]